MLYIKATFTCRLPKSSSSHRYHSYMWYKWPVYDHMGKKGIHVHILTCAQRAPRCVSSLYLTLPHCFAACQHSVGMTTVPVNQMCAHRSQVAGRKSNSAFLCRRIFNMGSVLMFSSKQTVLEPLPCGE